MPDYSPIIREEETKLIELRSIVAAILVANYGDFELSVERAFKLVDIVKEKTEEKSSDRIAKEIKRQRGY